MDKSCWLICLSKYLHSTYSVSNREFI